MSFLTLAAIDATALLATVASPERGAAATFIGTVRDHHGGRGVVALSYSAYHLMAEAECARIVAEAEVTWPVRVALAHRVGDLVPGDVAVAVIASSAHRDPAFAACRWVIEAVKEHVPIWKRERYVDGTEVWVDPTAAHL